MVHDWLPTRDEYEVFEDNDDGGDEVDSDFEILSLASTDSF